MEAFGVSTNGAGHAPGGHTPASRGLLRFTTAGSVDDGKSTLIGRLLVDSRQVADDQLAHVQEASRRRYGDGALDLALLTDGLRAEREQGITIDVAYRYFTTERRFILADVPGHREYTRNMVTGASTADLSIVLVDVHRGVVEQSRRHAYISALLRIPHLVVAVNKMDLVDYDQTAFAAVADVFEDIATTLGFPDRLVIPVSALFGDNVVTRSERMPWYTGPTLLEHLEQVELPYEYPDRVSARLPVQWIIRAPNGNPNGSYRGYAGQMASGILRAGDEVVLAPSGRRTRIASIATSDGPLEEAIAPQSVSLTLEDELDVGRGEMISRVDDPPTVASELDADVCWMSVHPLEAGRRYLLRQASRSVPVLVEDLLYCMDVQNFSPHAGIASLELNDIGRVRLRTSAPLAFDPYATNRGTGSFILIDEASNDTVAAGMIAGGPDSF